MTIEIEPKLMTPEGVDALIREAEALPDITKSLWTHNERELIDFCRRLAEALAGEHLLRRPDITGGPVSGYDLVAHLTRQIAFSKKAFGPFDRTPGIVAHIRKELDEVAASPGDVTEWMDIVLLGLDGAWRAGYSEEEITEALAAKLAKNEARQWPDWRDIPPDQPIEHVKGDAKARAFEADMFWDANDPEELRCSPEEIVIDSCGYGEVVEIQTAKRLPNIFVALLEPAADAASNDDWEYVGDSFDETQAALLNELARRAAIVTQAGG